MSKKYVSYICLRCSNRIVYALPFFNLSVDLRLTPSRYHLPSLHWLGSSLGTSLLIAHWIIESAPDLIVKSRCCALSMPCAYTLHNHTYAVRYNSDYFFYMWTKSKTASTKFHQLTPTPTPAWKNWLRLQRRLRPTSVSFSTCRRRAMFWNCDISFAMALMQSIAGKLDNKLKK